MTLKDNVVTLICRIDELAAQLEQVEWLVIGQAARLHGVKQELKTARLAVLDLMTDKSEDETE